MGGKHAHVVHGIEEHFGVAAAKMEHGGERVARAHGCDVPQRVARRCVDDRVRVHIERERHIGRGHGYTVLPVGARIEVEGQRHCVDPVPAGRELRHEVVVPDRIRRHPDIGELEEELVGHVASDGQQRDRGKQNIRLARRGDHERATVVTAAPAARLTAGECGEEEARGNHLDARHVQ